jgi:exonuclease III
MNEILTITTHNVKGLNGAEKQTSLLQFIKHNNLDIVGITETKLNPKHYQTTLKSDRNYFTYSNNSLDGAGYSGSGVLFIMKKSLKKHVHCIKTFHGRIIASDLYFKHNIILRIIVAYIPSFTNTTYTTE